MDHTGPVAAAAHRRLAHTPVLLCWWPAQLDSLRESAEEAKRLKKEAADLTARNEELEGLYKKEQVLRKKYWNMMEDMKGKVRTLLLERLGRVGAHAAWGGGPVTRRSGWPVSPDPRLLPVPPDGGV